MYVAGWGDLAFPSAVVAHLVEQLSPPAHRARFEAARTSPPAIPEGLGHHGLGGVALAKELGRLLRCPAFDRAVSLTFVPFALNGFDDPYQAFEVDLELSETGAIHRHVEGADEHLILEAGLVEASWPAIHEPPYADAVKSARRAVQRGAPTAHEHRLWLEHLLVEQLLPAAERLGLPVVLELPGRRLAEERTPPEALARLLDGALEDWS